MFFPEQGKDEVRPGASSEKEAKLLRKGRGGTFENKLELGNIQQHCLWRARKTFKGIIPSCLTEEAATGCRTQKTLEENIASAVRGFPSAGRVELLREEKDAKQCIGGGSKGLCDSEFRITHYFFLAEKKIRIRNGGGVRILSVGYKRKNSPFSNPCPSQHLKQTEKACVVEVSFDKISIRLLSKDNDRILEGRIFMI